jgi:hypothetical protein
MNDPLIGGFLNAQCKYMENGMGNGILKIK